MNLTPFQAKYFAHELTKRHASDSAEKLAGAVASAQVDLNPHQVDAALFAFNSPLAKGALLADEVGLGKTIEAGLVLSQKWAERKRRSLSAATSRLLTPGSNSNSSNCWSLSFSLPRPYFAMRARRICSFSARIIISANCSRCDVTSSCREVVSSCCLSSVMISASGVVECECTKGLKGLLTDAYGITALHRTYKHNVQCLQAIACSSRFF